MIDPNEVSIFIEKASIKWKRWAIENDRNYNSESFFWWFCNLDDEMQNRFVNDVDSGGS